MCINVPQGLGLVSWVIIPQKHVFKTNIGDSKVSELTDECRDRAGGYTWCALSVWKIWSNSVTAPSSSPLAIENQARYIPVGQYRCRHTYELTGQSTGNQEHRVIVVRGARRVRCSDHGTPSNWISAIPDPCNVDQGGFYFAAACLSAGH